MALDRIQERRRAVALARHYRDEEGLSIAEVARRLGRAQATVKAYLYDPTGEKARRVKARYHGACRAAALQPAHAAAKATPCVLQMACRPGAITPEWTRYRLRDAMRAWRDRYGRLPSSYRLVAHPRPSPRRASTGAARRWRLAAGKRRRRRVRELGRSARRGARGAVSAVAESPRRRWPLRPSSSCPHVGSTM